MNQPIIGTALPIAAVTLIAWSALLGNPNEPATVWLLRTLVVYPACHIAVRTYRHRRQPAPKKN